MYVLEGRGAMNGECLTFKFKFNVEYLTLNVDGLSPIAY